MPAATPTPTAADTGPIGAPACAVANLKASHGLVEGAAGSLMTEVVLVSADTCSVDAFPALGLRDAAGTGLVGAPSTGPGLLDLVPGVAYRSEVRLANWCAPEPDFPVTLVVLVGGADLTVTGDPFPEEGDLPPCNGEVGPILEGTEWAATP